ncbi:hypothetical protein [Streptomyces sp. NPDC056361]|uniref:hypothetical protein n=1 Tax=Streptomyces sp. NPDC056361 TaxID=3345795 RepID=UPI0035D5B492
MITHAYEKDGAVPAFRKALASIASVTALAVGLGLGAAAPAHAASCPSSAKPTIRGAKAEWVLSCSRGRLKVYGWVEDTLPDGHSALVDVWPGGGHHWKLVEADGVGERTNFDFEFPGKTSASVKLRLSR